MARYVTRVRTPRNAEEVFDYLSDLRSFAEWDPGVAAAEQVTGDGGGPGAEFDLTISSPGPLPDSTLRYRTVEYDRPDTLFVVASNAVLTSEDRITVVGDDAGCIVTYDADLRLSGPLRLGDVALQLAFNRIGDRAADGLRAALDGVRAA